MLRIRNRRSKVDCRWNQDLNRSNCEKDSNTSGCINFVYFFYRHVFKNILKVQISQILKFKPILWTSGLLTAYLGFLLLTDTEETPEYYPRYFTATLLRYAPLNGLSKVWGRIAEFRIPEVFRPLVYTSYAKFFQCDISEAENPDLKSYACLSEFFIRKLSPDKRPIHCTAPLISPADGVVLHCGPIDATKPVLEQIKGIHYSLDEFLGPTDHLKSWNKKKPDYRLYQCVIYLAPGDYHRFHSPVDWMPTVRRHFPGRLLSVRPNIAERLPGLYTINERVVYLGEWNYGLMSFTAVGAFGVGSIHINIDPALITNKRKDNTLRYRLTNTLMTTNPHNNNNNNINNNPPYLETTLHHNMKLMKGDELGYFRLGSTIVLIFQGPINQFQWCIKPGQRVKFGEPIIMAC
ncbi:unnamed protein product [Heterobilharzia americana]|nr:unnamed protein product [Heterobilharzia americana]